MSENHAGSEIRDESAPIEPPSTGNPLLPLVVPGLLTLVILGGVIYSVMPMWNAVSTVDQNLEKMRKDSVDAFSHSYQVPAPPPPVYVPGNNPNGPFTPKVP